MIKKSSKKMKEATTSTISQAMESTIQETASPTISQETILILNQNENEYINNNNNSNFSNISLSSSSPLFKGIPKRRVYTNANREWCLSVLDEYNGNYKEAANNIKKTKGYEAIKVKNLVCWMKNQGNWKRKGGKKVNMDFINEVNLLLIRRVEIASNGQEVSSKYFSCI